MSPLSPSQPHLGKGRDIREGQEAWAPMPTSSTAAAGSSEPLTPPWAPREQGSSCLQLQLQIPEVRCFAPSFCSVQFKFISSSNSFPYNPTEHPRFSARTLLSLSNQFYLRGPVHAAYRKHLLFAERGKRYGTVEMGRLPPRPSHLRAHSEQRLRCPQRASSGATLADFFCPLLRDRKEGMEGWRGTIW